MKKIIPFSLFLFLFSLTIGQTTYYQGMSYIQTVDHDDYQFALLRPDNSTRNIPYILNNYFQNLDTKGYLLDAGDETPVSTNNNLDGMVISGNKFKWNGTPGAPSTHGMFMGYNINMVVKYNYMDGVPYNILFKSGDASGNNMTCTTGGASYNIVKNPKMGVRSKGQSGVRIYNNTFYNSYSSGTLIYLDGNHDQPAFTSPQGTRIKNNIFYSVYDIPFFYVESGCLTDFQCDYNVYYCQNSTNHYPTFNVNGTSYSWTAWRALGYDTHSVVINPNFNNTTDFVPSARLNYGTDLGSEFNTGLSTSANWVVGTAPATQIQNGTWQVGARIYASTVTPVIPTVTTTPISSITTTTAVSGGNVSSDGNSPVTERGVCWDQAGFPALDNVHTHDGTGTGNFTSNITGLSTNTTYYVRAYATNSVGTGYGNTISFTTGQVIPNEGTWFVSTTGNDATGNGSIDSPWFTLNKAWSVAKAGDYIYMRGGTYIYNNEQVLTNKNGTVTSPIRIVAYQNEKPIISPSSAFYTSGYNDGIVIRDCQYIHIKNLEITGYKQPRPNDWGNGITALDISNCVFENLNIHHGCFGMTLGNDDGITDNNLILNCDFHHNSDPITDFPPPYDQLFAYGNADGLTIRIDGTLGLGTTNYVVGCRMWYNSDDGIDLWSNEGMIVIKDSWAFLNGYYNDTTNPNPGDGNGFKLGLSNIDNHSTVLRKVYNCIGYMNKGWGFVRNGAACNMEIYNNTSYSNGITGYGGGFFFGNDGGPVGDIPFYIKNNIAYSNITNYSFWSNELLQNVDHNTWNLPVTVTNTDFVNLNASELTLPRQADGSLPEIGFLHLSTGSDLIGKGVEVGIPHDGTNPDLGAFDFKENLPSIFQIIVSRGYVIKTINNARVTTGTQ